MSKRKLTVEELKAQISRIQADWLNSKGIEIIKAIDYILNKIKERIKEGVSIEDIIDILKNVNYSIEVFRLALDESKDEFINDLILFIQERGYGIKPPGRDIEGFCSKNAEVCAEFLVEKKGITNLLTDAVSREYSYKDILIERLKWSRGVAIKGQKRGRTVEDAVRRMLEELGIEYTYGRNFKGKEGREAKADFAIPSHDSPIVIIEVKAYEATGSKQTDVLGDILKILSAKPDDVRFYLVTDGIGWLRRETDLQKIVELYNEGRIDGIYTLSTLDELKKELEVIKRKLLNKVNTLDRWIK